MSATTKPTRPKPLRRRGAARTIAEHAPEPPSEPGRDAGLIEHPDGWYWVAPDGHQQFGPFESGALARADRDRASVEAVNEAEAEREAQVELGVADAIEADLEGPADSDQAERRLPEP